MSECEKCLNSRERGYNPGTLLCMHPFHLRYSVVVLVGRVWGYYWLEYLELEMAHQYLLKILGFLALTRVGSRRVTQIAAGFMIFFSILGKFGAVFASIPAPIVAALYCLFFAYVGSAGLSFLQFCNLKILQ
ncbi:hypothetical protein Leryth_019979 [Lithospermum erythrorhizon]|nr:hypothetical protein Leryth_019979 [Lithospermum erythrorhizon]